MDPWLTALAGDGYCLLPGVLPAAECDRLLAEWDAVQARAGGAVLRTEAGHAYGARDLLAVWPAVAWVARRAPLPQLLAALLGPGYGLVRGLFFDKPPGASWALPWHKDVTVAVRDNTLPSAHFSHPTRKNGQPHAEAPTWLLERMLTARVHLDDVTDENGPLRVLPGSHHAGKDLNSANEMPRRILCARGDVLLMRPLLAHASGHAVPATSRHRRILHLEFAGVPTLPDGYTWQTFIRANEEV